ncbi:hypothetical protein N657DRAFT_249123 [Parathielavia appendiculata]|uniref:Uncharacterized protein n=1 Tax=Parathielavia appendiculata TaxID=2587402 RepID=A0AAN6TT17_9PEZI|nr:hypothetical protein N657DRAFT_249123 [Parathielavia appendiculata]
MPHAQLLILTTFPLCRTSTSRTPCTSTRSTRSAVPSAPRRADAKAITDVPLDPKLYPKIQGPDNRFYHLRAHFKIKDGPSWVNAHGMLDSNSYRLE